MEIKVASVSGKLGCEEGGGAGGGRGRGGGGLAEVGRRRENDRRGLSHVDQVKHALYVAGRRRRRPAKSNESASISRALARSICRKYKRSNFKIAFAAKEEKHRLPCFWAKVWSTGRCRAHFDAAAAEASKRKQGRHFKAQLSLYFFHRRWARVPQMKCGSIRPFPPSPGRPSSAPCWSSFCYLVAPPRVPTAPKADEKGVW